MTLDIKSGDFLVIGSKSYPIKKANSWTMDDGDNASFEALSTVSCSIQRSPAEDVNMLIGPAVDHLTGKTCIPLAPIGDQLARDTGLESVVGIYQTFIADADGYVHLLVQDSERD